MGTPISSLVTGATTLWQGKWVLGGTVGTCQGTCCCPCQAGPRSGCSISPGGLQELLWATGFTRIHKHTCMHAHEYIDPGGSCREMSKLRGLQKHHSSWHRAGIDSEVSYLGQSKLLQSPLNQLVPGKVLPGHEYHHSESDPYEPLCRVTSPKYSRVRYTHLPPEKRNNAKIKLEIILIEAAENQNAITLYTTMENYFIPRM